MARLWRVHHPGLSASSGESFDLAPIEARHVQRVLRLRTGERIAVFDGTGSEWVAVLEASGPAGVTVRLEQPIDRVVESSLEVALFQGLCKPERIDWVLQKATEVGVSAIYLLVPPDERARTMIDRRLDRWHRIIVEACKQCGRRRLPAIALVERLPAPDGATTLALLLDPREEADALAAVCEGRPRPEQVWLGVGPEGGFDADDIGAATREGWLTAHLGPRTLRSDTAGLVAASIVLHRWADLGGIAGSDDAG